MASTVEFGPGQNVRSTIEGCPFKGIKLYVILSGNSISNFTE